ncbi:MAG: mechanosensitive ion channel [Acidobacteriaceae bacterium]|nr:mechanosensitive ion channel [Acidobacteriaceae bacterium]
MKPVSFSLLGVGVLLPLSAFAAAPQATTAKTPTAAGGTQTAGAESGSAASHASPASANLQQRIAQLPPLSNTGVEVKQQGDLVRNHLGDVLRFYRSSTTSVQKTGEPSDILYQDQMRSQVTSVAQFAFEATRNVAALLSHVSGDDATLLKAGASETKDSGDAARMTQAKVHAQERMATLQQQKLALAAQLDHATAKTRPELLQQQEQVEGGLELAQATYDALNRITRFSSAQSGHSGLMGDIDHLEASAPELSSDSVGKTVSTAPVNSLAEAQHAGLVTQASALFDLLSTRRTIDEQLATLEQLQKQVQALRTPFLKVLRSTMSQGEKLTQQNVDLKATPTSDAQDLTSTRKQFDQLTNTFRVMADATFPLSQESLMLDSTRGTLTGWRVAVDTEYRSILRSLLLRVGSIALALILLAVIGHFWNHATLKYVTDLRRRRQLLVVRRMVLGFAGGIVLLFGFITQFSSLATFAGFISAGIAVGLQTILLSVAAYFFIVGRYGVRVGDRITVAGVTGTVIEVGIARFYMMELVGTGTELHSTGRVAVFANSVLFQTGTPLYKQLPGTEYAWHELTAKLKPDADADAVLKHLSAIVENVYNGYKSVIDAQQRQIEAWAGTAVDPPRIDSHIRLMDDGLQVALLFPVQIADAAEADAAIASVILSEWKDEGVLRTGLSATPVIKAAVKS